MYRQVKRREEKGTCYKNNGRCTRTGKELEKKTENQVEIHGKFEVKCGGRIGQAPVEYRYA